MKNTEEKADKKLVWFLYEYQLKLTERWINGDKDDLETFINNFALGKNQLVPLIKTSNGLLEELILLKTDEELSSLAYSKLIKFVSA